MAMAADGDLTVAEGTIDVARPDAKTTVTGTLRDLATASGRTPGAMMREWGGLSFGPGKLSFDEYVALGLYDSARFAGADLKSFAGLRVTQDIWRQINFRTDLYGMVQNKIGMTAILAAHGFPTIPIAALFSQEAGFTAPHALHDREALRGFLAGSATYPLFGKPMDGYQSLGSASFAGYDAAHDTLLADDGRATALDAYLDDVVAHYAGGYMFQRRVSPHAGTRAICGDRLATVRVITLVGADGPRILRVCEKIPGGTNAADNFWRPGNLLVQLDPQSGTRGRAISGHGPSFAEHTRHPDSGAAIAGTIVPNWTRVCTLALEGAKLVKELPLIGWDIAPTDEGAVIVEVNYAPDFMLPQMADRRGMLDAELRAAIEHGRKAERAATRDRRTARRESLRQSFMK